MSRPSHVTCMRAWVWVGGAGVRGGRVVLTPAVCTALCVSARAKWTTCSFFRGLADRGSIYMGFRMNVGGIVGGFYLAGC